MKAGKKSVLLRAISRYSLRHKGRLICGLLCLVVGTALSMVIPMLVGNAVDYAVAGAKDLGAIPVYCAVIASATCLAGAFTWGGNVLLSTLCFTTVRDIRMDLYAKLLTLPLSEIEGYSRGDLMSRMTTMGENLSDGLYQLIMQLSSGAVTMIVTIVCMYILNWAVATVIVCLTPLSALVAHLIAKRNRVAFKKQGENIGRMSGMSEEYISGSRLLRSYGKVAESEAEFAKVNDDLFKSGLASQFAGATVNPLSRFVNNIIYAVVVIVGGVFVLGTYGGWAGAAGAALSIGGLSAFLSYANQFARPFNDLTNVAVELQTAAASGRRIFRIIGLEDEDKGGTAKVDLPVDYIEFDKVSFSYSPDKPFIRDLSFRADGGSKIALVGTTGSGKTTVINLIMRFYDPDGGNLIYDGEDIRKFSRADVRRSFGMVLQDTWLFGGTIRENIAYGKPDATEEEIRHAAEIAHLDSFVSTLADGYDTVISGDGEELSEGQKQLIAIARVFLVSPEMLILDEATASVDAITERSVQSAFAELMGNKTTFVVAHRLSTIKDSDLIVVMDGGKVVEKGTHDELVRLGGLYSEMLKAACGE